METTAGVKSYSFFTNFTIPKSRDVNRLFDLTKLSDLAISIYGYDPKTFVDITQSTEKVYRRLVYNIETFLGENHRRRFSCQFSVHPGRRAVARPDQRDHAADRTTASGRNRRQDLEGRLQQLGRLRHQ